MPVGNPAPPRPRSPDALTSSMTSFGCIAERLLQPLVALVLQEEVEGVAVRLADVSGEDRFHSVHRLQLRRPTELRSHSTTSDDNPSAPPRPGAFRCHPPASRTTLRRRPLVPVLVVHHHHRRAVAGAEALELEQREHARRVGLADLDARASRCSASVTRSAPASAHDSVRHTCSTYLPTGALKNIT